jgi:predicted peroxiredoxin
MASPEMSAPATPRLVILLERAVTVAQVQSALRYASTAAAMDVAVEVHAVGASVALLHRNTVADAGWRAALDQALELGVELYACPQALAGQVMRAEDLISGVCGIRGAASLLAAGLAPGGRFMVF